MVDSAGSMRGMLLMVCGRVGSEAKCRKNEGMAVDDHISHSYMNSKFIHSNTGYTIDGQAMKKKGSSWKGYWGRLLPDGTF
jgi:hypothetical protein